MSPASTKRRDAILRRIVRHAAPPALFALLASSFGGCGESVTFAEKYEAGTPPFIDPDAGPDDASDEGSTAYCPSNRCPDGFTTCPTSRFPCDVNLKTDRENCGACGSVCPVGTNAGHACVEGRCKMTCLLGYFDCDDVVDNGCEIHAGANDHCRGCGDRCADPEKPCARRNPLEFGCGCLGEDIVCEIEGIRTCIDPRTADKNCGACGRVCDPDGDGGPPRPNAYYGCVDRECGHVKCRALYGDCDDDIFNGCETKLLSHENCGACGKVCPSGLDCKIDDFGEPACLCPAGLTYCASASPKCVDLTSNPEHCGACNSPCLETDPQEFTYSVGVCNYGTCSRRCVQGRADCNGNPLDDCEIDINSDPRNCGGCGKVCDAIAGQACVGGRCVVEPCGQDGGVVAR